LAAEFGDNVGEEAKYDEIANDIWQASATWRFRAVRPRLRLRLAGAS
jgi:hypothetical protein